MASRENDARIAAESLLTGSSSSQSRQPIINQSQEQIFNNNQIYRPIAYPDHSINSPSIDLINEEVLGGIRHNGQMSGVRRFFCLFLTFDLLLTFLMWLICIMLMGNDIVTALENQIVHYNVHTSIFDVVMVSACRFTVLLLFYALLYINHWSVIALSTSGTCAFLIYKVFVFQWSAAQQPVFQVLIILTSFVLAWGETWFLDFRVIPQETLASTLILDTNPSRTVLQGGRLHATERTPLLGSYLRSLPDNYTESLGNFYSPLESPHESDNEDDDVRSSHHRDNRLSAQVLPKTLDAAVEESNNDEHTTRGLLGTLQRTVSSWTINSNGASSLYTAEVCLQQEARDTLGKAWALVNSKTGWKQEKLTADGAVVESRSVPKQSKIFRLTCRLNFTPRALLDELFYNVENMPSWNPTIVQSRKLQVLDDHTDVIYQVSAEGGGGVVTSREFIVLRHWSIRDGAYVLAGSSTMHPDVPKDKKFIRGHSGPNCYVMKSIPHHPNECILLWLLDTDLKGWVPQYVVETALSGAMLEFVDSLRLLTTSSTTP